MCNVHTHNVGCVELTVGYVALIELQNLNQTDSEPTPSWAASRGGTIRYESLMSLFIVTKERVIL